MDSQCPIYKSTPKVKYFNNPIPFQDIKQFFIKAHSMKHKLLSNKNLALEPYIYETSSFDISNLVIIMPNFFL